MGTPVNVQAYEMRASGFKFKIAWLGARARWGKSMRCQCLPTVVGSSMPRALSTWGVPRRMGSSQVGSVA